MRISDWSSDVCSSDLNATARVHNDLGNLYKRRRQNNKALVHYKKALDLVRQLNFLPGISACLSNIGTVYLELRNPRDALPYLEEALDIKVKTGDKLGEARVRSEEHTSELQSLMRISYAVLCLKQKNITRKQS